MSAETLDSSPSAAWRLENSYRELPEIFYASCIPTRVHAPQLVVLNEALAESLGLPLQQLLGQAGAALLSGNQLPTGANPLAQAYAGHQFGHFTTLGDGRAILLGEQITPRGERFDVQLKGSGQTPFSRRGDGRAALGPMLREYIISEAMAALGIPTTRSLAVVATGEPVWREEALPGAVLTRIAASHIRVGTFEWASATGDPRNVRALVDYTLRRHYPDGVGAENPALVLLEGGIERQAALIAKWMAVGFVHGVMNTDNMALSGETIDYGPCAFLDVYHSATVFSSIDRNGRYAYGNQPKIAQWNLTRFAETLLHVLHPEEKEAVELAEAALRKFGERFHFHWLELARKKLGLFDREPEDGELIQGLLDWMQTTKADFTNTFASLDETALPEDEGFRVWQQKWVLRLKRQPQSASESRKLRRLNNPAFIPRNHLVEAALFAAQDGDLSVLKRLLEVISEPFDYSRNAPEYRESAPEGSAPYRTFCGT